MKTLIKKALVAIMSLCCAFSINCLPTFARDQTANIENRDVEIRSKKSDGVLNFSYTMYSTNDYGIFTVPDSGFDYDTIVVDTVGEAAGYANDFINAISDAGTAYEAMLVKTSGEQMSGFIALMISGPLPPLAILSALQSLSLRADAEKLALEVNAHLLEAETAFAYLYRYRVTENGGCVTISGQEVCPMNV